MKINARQLEDGASIEGDVILVGGGIVGLALGNQLADAGHEVVILESGSEEPEERTQALYQGSFSMGGPTTRRQQDAYMEASRVRYFGGSGNRWGGVSLPLDPADFESRDWVPYSGWPLTLDQLKPFYNRASDLLEIGRFFPEVDGGAMERPPMEINQAKTLHSRPVHVTRYTGHVDNGPFHSWKRQTLERERLRVYLGANVTRVALAADGQSVESLDVKTLDGRKLSARGKIYVLATGGIENIRLMLASNDVLREGIGNHSDWLGRCFQGHAAMFNAFSQMMPLVPSQKWRTYVSRSRDHVSWILGTTLEAQKAARSANFCMYLRPIKIKQKNEQALHQIALRLAGEEAPGLQILRANYGIEHTPNRDSRIVLERDSQDELGLPKVAVEWKHQPLDFEGFERSVRQAAQELGLHDVGRLRWSGLGAEADKFVQIGARHHMGATRMSPDPKQGVVDTLGRVHGIGNCYVGGSSIFPTSGLANPTLTILALTLRLGDHLDSKLASV